jgi:4-alpha-glucanotransferase
MVRIDHFRGLAACWAVPAGEATARKGTWEPAPGEALLAALAKKLGADLPIIAEDLGFITEDVRRLRDGFGLPGMRILQFGFDAEESGKGLDPANPFLPHNYSPDCVAYTGTHDNDTLAGWLASASREEIDFVEAYLGYAPRDAARALIREAMKSAAGLAVFPMQDVLGLGSEARMNTPGTIGGNWAWRLSSGALDRPTAAGLRAMAAIYGRPAYTVTEPVGGPGASRHPSL